MAYDDKEATEPCQLEYAVNESSSSHVILAFELDKEHRPDKTRSWQFREPDDLCAGGIKRTLFYMMKVTQGYSLDVEEARTRPKLIKLLGKQKVGEF